MKRRRSVGIPKQRIADPLAHLRDNFHNLALQWGLQRAAVTRSADDGSLVIDLVDDLQELAQAAIALAVDYEEKKLTSSESLARTHRAFVRAFAKIFQPEGFRSRGDTIIDAFLAGPATAQVRAFLSAGFSTADPAALRRFAALCWSPKPTIDNWDTRKNALADHVEVMVKLYLEMPAANQRHGVHGARPKLALRELARYCAEHRLGEKAVAEMIVDDLRVMDPGGDWLPADGLVGSPGERVAARFAATSKWEKAIKSAKYELRRRARKSHKKAQSRRKSP